MVLAFLGKKSTLIPPRGETGIWRGANITTGAKYISTIAELREKLLFLNLPDRKKLPHILTSGEKNQANLDFNHGFAEKLTSQRRPWDSIISTHGHPRKNGTTINQTHISSTLSRFLELVDAYEKTPSKDLKSKILKESVNLFKILERATCDLKKLDKSSSRVNDPIKSLKAEHIVHFAHQIQDLKPIVVCAFFQRFRNGYRELFTADTVSVANHLRRATLALLNVVQDSLERNENLVALKA